MNLLFFFFLLNNRIACQAFQFSLSHKFHRVQLFYGRTFLSRRKSTVKILPELSTPDRKSVKLFPHVLINGRYQQHMQERRRLLSGAYWAERQPYMTINADKKTDQVFRYEMKVPYESWMDGATLVLRQVQTSPGGVRRVFTVDVNGAVDVSRK